MGGNEQFIFSETNKLGRDVRRQMFAINRRTKLDRKQAGARQTECAMDEDEDDVEDVEGKK